MQPDKVVVYNYRVKRKLRVGLKGLIDFFINNPYRNRTENSYRQARLIVLCDLLTILVDIFYVIISIYANFPQGIVALSIAACLYTINAFLFRTSLPSNFLGNMYCAIFFMVIMVLGYYSGALKQHSVILPWLLLVPAIALLLTNRVSSWAWWVMCVMGLVALSQLESEDTPILYNMQYDIVVVILLHSGLALIALVINTVFETNKSQALAALEQANQKVSTINNTLEVLVQQRTIELENKNKVLEEYAFINAHKLRSPVATILGLTSLLDRQNLEGEAAEILEHLKKSTERLDDTIREVQSRIRSVE
ncbi:histidine kinase dimerization/phospho-acceptor domain-containing protein [Cytophagales bacterium LB-30]|uniref:histidine kinase n=1 Tax=Shiella aurantiaca TaxID=3058365 RepID=A0ABT8F3M4_9BACT|nr:histidine kinase dimerization/phospho-acceptor domain-containing protein [Shiella aurantiaca]MDN4164978.1 histidine kinase dimerization/phospho-acceptor domain-containing protein [Shiella aurantiaca]